MSPHKDIPLPFALTTNDGIPRTGGAWQVVTDGGKSSHAVRR